MSYIKHIEDCTRFEAGDLTLLREILHPDNDGVAINYSIAHAIIQPGKSSLKHQLKGSETYYILQGEGVIYIDDTAHPLKKGSVAYVPAQAIQYVENTGTQDLAFLCIVEPYWKEEDEAILE